ncbi:MAG: hypothetical protein QM757_27530 [Paludibaculum sp.]
MEGLLNNVDRPPVTSRDGARVLFEGEALPHFNEVDECCGLDALITNRVWTKLGYDPETTLHDVRYGEQYNGDYVWVYLISGAVPPAHNQPAAMPAPPVNASLRCTSARAAAR